MTDQYEDHRNYTKDRVHHVGFPEAARLIQDGWVASREAWPKGTIVFFAKEGSFVAADLITGHLEPFYVMRAPSGLYGPWAPDGFDIHAIDWACITRQTFQRQMPDSHAATGQRNVTQT